MPDRLTGPTSNCRSCGAEIRWVLTTAGRRMPVDAEPHLVMVSTGETLLTDGPLVKPAYGYTSHFATCPHAAQHRRPRLPSSRP